MKKIRVLHVIKTLTLGGAETNLLNLIKVQDSDLIETHVAYSFGGEIEDRFRSENLRLYKYASRVHKIKSLASIGIVIRLMSYIVREKIDIVHTHNFNAHIWAALAARWTGRKLVEHVHDFRYIDKADREKGRCFVDQYEHIRKFKGFSDRVVVLTRQNEHFLAQNKFCSPDKIKLIRNGISLGNNKPANPDARKRWGIPQDHTVFLTPARMAGEKNIDILFQIAPIIIKRFPKTTFLVSGDGPLLETYKKRAVDENLTGVIRFIGFYQDTMELLGFAYAMILPSFLELHPISILEALSMKVPVIVSSGVGCNSEVFESWQNGVLLDPYDPPVWSEAILKLLEDHPLRDSVAREGYKLCQEEFDIRKVVKKFEGLYAELVSH